MSLTKITPGSLDTSQTFTFANVVITGNVQATNFVTPNGAPLSTGTVSNIAGVSDQVNTSTGYLAIPSGNTAQRPVTPVAGSVRYNSTTGFAEVYTAGGWGIFGAMPPSISSVSPATYNGETGTSFTISGVNFTSDAAIRFVTVDGTEVSAATVTFANSTTILATTSRDFTVAEGPLDVKLLQASGTTTALDCIQTGSTPTWTTASGTLGTLYYPADTTYSYQLTATDADANSTITYAVTTGSLPPGASIASATGLITGNLVDPAASSVTTTFSVTPTDNAGNQGTARSFNIIRKWQDGSTQAQAATSASAIYNLSTNFRGSSANGVYWIKLTGQATASQIYCNMVTAVDGGGWMLIYRKPGNTTTTMTYKQIWYMNSTWTNSTYSDDTTNYPAMPTGLSFKTLGFTKQMFNNTHSSWISGVGDYQWYPMQETLAWSSSSITGVNNYKVSTSSANTVTLYSRNSVWGNATSINDNWSWWPTADNSGICGGPNICGTLCCPSATPTESCHTNGSVPLYIYVK